jgi:NRAMP (natural resistance-associated macrophage protein)-like metal ion transporter
MPHTRTTSGAESHKATEDRKQQSLRPFWKRLGPGLITGAADDDPSGIGTYSVVGAQFGHGMLWLTLFCLPLMIVVQEMCGRIGAITGKGLAAVIKEHYPRGILWGAVALLICANTINVWADLNVMAASARMLFGLPFGLWLTVITAATLALQVCVPYKVYVRYLKWLCLALLAYVVTGLLPAMHDNWPQIARSLLIPQWSRDPAFVMTVVGFLGTTISPYLFFWQAGETVEEEIEDGKETEPGHRRKRVTEAEIRMMRADTVIGMVASQAITFFIILCTAATLHARGLTHVETAQEAAQALMPLGRAAYWLFTLGIIGTGLLAIPTLAGSAAYAVSETVGWRYGLYRRFDRARGFYLTIAAVIVLGYLLNFVRSVSPIRGLLYTAVINGVIAPPLIVLLLLICNNGHIVQKRRNSLLSNVLGWLTVILMTAAAVAMFRGMLRGPG